MKALVKVKATPGIWMEDVDLPLVGHNDALVKVNRTAICGTDIHIYHWDDWAKKTIPLSMVVGHEFSGEIVELGSEVVGLKVGQRVSAEGHITCGHCRNCRAGKRHLCRNTQGIGVNRPGAFAEFISVPSVNICPLPEQVSDDMGAILDPLGNAAHTALSFDLVGEDVLVTGAGPIGIMAVAIARRVGAHHIVVTDINDYRLQLAKKMGATRVVNVGKENLRDVMEELTMLEGFDVGLEMSGAPKAFATMLDTLNHGAKVAMLGLMPAGTGINWEQVIFKGLEIHGIYGRRMFETWYKMISMIQSGLDLKPIITHRFSAEEFQSGFDAMVSGQSGKVLLEWT